MPSKHFCKQCRRKKPWVSTRGYCKDCGFDRRLTAAMQLKQKKGHWYRKWKRGMKQWAKTL